MIEKHINNDDTTFSNGISLLKVSYELERLAMGAATSPWYVP